MSFYRSLILLTVLLFCTFYSDAQDNNYKYNDTTVLNTDSVESEVVAIDELAPVETDENEDYEDYQADTILKSNQLSVDPDSIKTLKNLKSLRYAKNLDSLLNEYQQSLAADNASVNNRMSWLERLLLSPITKYFFWMIAAVLVSFLLYKLFFTAGFFQRPFAKINVTILPGEGENLSTKTDYGKLILQAVNAGNYRMAVRYHYLQSLQKLSLKGAIQFAADKTNYQYLRELSGKPYKNAFASLTLNYEYVWYGEFEINENVFHVIQNKFKLFNSEL